MKMKKLINKKAGVSAVIGVILMVAVTIAIAFTVYVYVNNMFVDVDYTEYISGNLTNIQYSSENKYLITLDNDSYVIGFDRYKDEFYSFTIGNFYTFRIAPDDTTTLVIEINAIH